MKTMFLGRSGPEVPVIAPGCMRINRLDSKALVAYLQFVLDRGLYFLTMPIFTEGEKCERLFAEALPQTGYKREDIIIQSKCGIHPGVMYDCSKEHILRSVTTDTGTAQDRLH